MKELSQQEERVMRLFWKKGQALVRDVLDELPEPKPPYTTLASTIRLLEKKGYLTHKVYGTTHMYIPTVSQEEYSKSSINHMVKHFFEGSVGNFLSFMVKEKKISKDEVEDLQKLIDDYEKKGKK
ncbi:MULTISPECIES: BlaI/MecI/CopY family transcriptional regulator [Algoriphagus]|jgi:predicted transcriptional regulator|uniref:Predicted transcriptional regulator n=1 Tax=Algoriphagus zhangzhouensis TaxID=1073327 RepID=A0A1M7Z445_9BACT|nr:MULTISPECIES: BlaI/MecI/CopY family transcriptional regulator [Algoriphagus]TDY48588.1 putative transcriptional regulator [Algoriphagus zhangzhouensis]SHO59651.1 Predicted transcriptional regulator [Algoriphagus zhangzhouensis]